MNSLQPDYHRIFNDILSKKNPVNKIACLKILEKKDLSALDVIKLNTLIFNYTERNTPSGIGENKHRSYNKTDILYMLDFQKENGYNNSQISLYFRVSRNSIAKWRKIFGY
ncbi:transposase [Chryseobacterium indologenes]|uniref:transposase n=1 Tax=Chryseobacterium indologenes TaxID=253 RepID=UPI000CFCC63A|nr:transposase [Chryseobacterium indologenes]AVK73267.1 transposase [Chryseobacterium indologenes]